MIGIEFTYNDLSTSSLQMRTSFSELLWSDFVRLCDNAKIEDVEQRILENIAVLCNTDAYSIASMQEADLIKIIPFLSFIDNPEVVTNRAISEQVTNCQIATQPWKLLETAKQVIQANQDVYSLNRAMPEIIKIYTNIDITNMPFNEAFPIAEYFKQQLEDFFKQFTKLNEYKPKSEQVLAGIDQLNQYGFFTTVHALCKGNPLIYDVMLNRPAIQVYQTLLYDYEVSQYMDRLNEIHNRKNKVS